MMEYEKILNNLKNKIFKPIYVFYGEESYFIDKLTDFIEEDVLLPSEKAFNQTILYGKDVTAKDIIEVARRFPMAANHQVVIVKEAQDVSDLQKLDVYLTNPMISTLLVLNLKNTKTLDKGAKIFKPANKFVEFFESKKLTEKQIYAWINNFLKNEGLTIYPDALRLFYESIGNNLNAINNELEKIKIFLPKGSNINVETIASLIGVSRDFNVFELQKALGYRDIPKIYKIMDYLMTSNNKENSLIAVTIRLFDYFSKIIKVHTLKQKDKNSIAAEIGVPSFFADEYITACRNYSLAKCFMIVSYLRETHMKALGVNNNVKSEKELAIELIFKMIH